VLIWDVGPGLAPARLPRGAALQSTLRRHPTHSVGLPAGFRNRRPKRNFACMPHKGFDASSFQVLFWAAGDLSAS
jgi:hypothetical protein